MRINLLIVLLLALLPITNTHAKIAEHSEINTAPVTTPTSEASKPDLSNKEISDLTPEEVTKQVFQAIEASDEMAIKPLLNALTYYKHNDEGETALTLAIQNDDEEMVSLLVEDAVINLKNKAGETPLTLAIKKGNPKIIELVSKRAKAALKNDAGEAPLFLAIENDDLFLIQKLINKGADVNRKSNGTSPIAQATQLNKARVLALLIRNGANPSQANCNGDLPLYLAVKNNFDVVSGILLHKSKQADEDANWMNQIGEPLINIAAAEGNTQIVRTLLEFGASPNSVDMMENTPLNIAAEKGDLTTMQLLVENGATVNHANIMGTTPIMAAARNGHNEVASQLALLGADPELRDYSGIAANDYGDFKAKLILLDEEADAVFMYDEPSSDDDKGNQ